MHQPDPDEPAVFIKHVGHAIRCTCGRYYVAGHRCPADRPLCASGIHAWRKVYGWLSGARETCDNCGTWRAE